ncbi:hypothetical protein ACWA1C_00260 [Flectobacillus roseus]
MPRKKRPLIDFDLLNKSDLYINSAEAAKACGLGDKLFDREEFLAFKAARMASQKKVKKKPQE